MERYPDMPDAFQWEFRAFGLRYLRKWLQFPLPFMFTYLTR